MTNQRMKWDAEAAFKSLNAQGKRRQASIDDERLKTTPYTPPPNVAAWLRAQADKQKAGRDYDAILRAAKKPPVGYYEDAPRGPKFVAKPTRGDLEEDCFSNESDAVAACRTGEHVEKMPDGTFAIYPDSTCPKCGNMMVAGHYCSTGGATAPTTPPPAAKKPPVGYYEDVPHGIKFGGQPLPSASTKPHGKDVDTADGPWPKCIHHRERGGEFLDVYESDGNGKQYHPSGVIFTCSQTYSGRIGTIPYGTAVANGKAAQWLEAHGHKDAAAQLRGAPRADVATGGGRVWMNRAPRHFTETCYEHWRAVLIDGKVCTRGAWNKPGVWSGEANDVPSLQELESGSYPELFGTERDAILAECRKAMPCPQKPAS